VRGVVILIAAGVVIAGAQTVAASSSTATPYPLVVQAKAEIAALERAEGSYYSERQRYTSRLADLLPVKGGKDVGLQSPGLDIHADASSDGKWIILRVASRTIGLGRVLHAGQRAGQMCEVLDAGGVC